MADEKGIVKSEPMRIGKGGIIPKDMGDLWRLAEAVSRSSLCPRGATKEDVFLCLDYGMAIGMPWSMAISTIAPINGKPAIYGRGMIGVVRASGLLEDVQESYDGTPGADDYAAVCTLKRKGQPTPKVSRFTIADAKRARLWGKAGPWTDHPYNQLMWRARGRAYGEMFADVLCGLYVAEETEGDDYSPRPQPVLQDVVIASENVEPPQPIEVGETEPIGQKWDGLPGMDAATDAAQAELLPKPKRVKSTGPVASVEEIDAALGGGR